MASSVGKKSQIYLYYGVVEDNVDMLAQGRIVVNVGEISGTQGHRAMAFPVTKAIGNSFFKPPYGGRVHCGEIIIPNIGEKVLLLGSSPDPHEAVFYYIGSYRTMDAINDNPNDTPILPEIGMDIYGKSAMRKIIYRSVEGQSFYFSTAPVDNGVWLTGKKYLYNPNTRDPQYKLIKKIDDNQSVIIIHDDPDLSWIEIVGLKKVVIRDNHTKAEITIQGPNININAKSSVNIKAKNVTIDGNLDVKGSCNCK